MAQVEKIDIAVLLRCRYRVWQLSFCLKNLYDLFNGTHIKYKIYLIPDRPTNGVENVIKYHRENHKNIEVIPVSDGCTGHRWAKSGMEGMNYVLQKMDSAGVKPNWIWFHDDDEVLPVGSKGQLCECLRNQDILAWVATSLYLWDSFRQANMNIFHYSPIISRYRPGDRLPTDGRSTQVTEQVQKRILRNIYRKKTLPFFLYDLSAMTRKDREAQIERFKQANKDDLYTRSFAEPPQIMTVGDIEKGFSPQAFAELQARRKGLMGE